MEKQDLQEQEYTRPYHHLVNLGPFSRMHEYYGDLEYRGYVGEVLCVLPYGTMQRVAEVGCGDGKITLELAKRNPEVKFEGFDISERAILYAKAFGFSQANLQFFAKDFKDAGGIYDAVVCVETLEHISDNMIPAFVDSLRKKTKKYLIVSVPSVNIPLSKKHYRHYNIEILKNQLVGFELQSIKYVCVENWITRLFLKILINRFFISQTRYVVNPILKLYDKFYKYGNENNGRHLVAVFVAKD